jgi:uncharacterized membrane protein YkvA (DUF1232 family)
MAALKEAALAVPRVALLIPKLLADERVPTRTKLALAGLGVYLISPWDFLPDFIPVLGQLDDVAAILILLDGILNRVDDAILLQHWRGEEKTLRRLQWLARLVSRWVPDRLKDTLFGRAVEEGRKRLERDVEARVAD